MRSIKRPRGRISAGSTTQVIPEGPRILTPRAITKKSTITETFLSEGSHEAIGIDLGHWRNDDGLVGTGICGEADGWRHRDV
jgi:hypothetical protein